MGLRMPRFVFDQQTAIVARERQRLGQREVEIFSLQDMKQCSNAPPNLAQKHVLFSLTVQEKKSKIERSMNALFSRTTWNAEPMSHKRRRRQRSALAEKNRGCGLVRMGCGS